MGTKRSTGVGLHVEGADKFAADLRKADGSIKQTAAEVKKLDAAYGKGSTNTDYLTRRTQALTQQLELQQKRTATLRDQLSAYEATGKTTTAQLEKYRLEILRSETAEAALARQITEANTALKAQGLSVDEVAKNLDGFAKKAGTVGDSLTRALTIPIAGMGTYALSAALELEDAMKAVATLPGVVGRGVEEQVAQLDEYTDAILAASNATHTAAEALAMAQYQAISAGTAAEESVQLVERSAKAAKSGMSDVETVVDGATSILNAWKESAGGINHVLDAMMVTQNEGKTTIGDLASNIGQVTGLAPQLGVALDEVLAATAALTKGGVSTSSAINGLKAVFSNILKPTAEACEEAERLGLQFDATALQTQGFTGFLESVFEATKGDSESLAKLFGSVEGLSQIMALGTTQAEEYARILTEIENSAGAVDEAFAVRMSSKTEQLKGSLNELRNSGTELAENLYPAVDAVTDLIGGAATVIGEMDEGTQKTLVGILGIVAAVGPATKALATLTSTVSKLIPLLSGPWGLAAAGVAVAGGLVIALNNAETSSERLERSIQNMNLTPDAESLDALSGKIQTAIDEVDAEKLIKVTASVHSDFSAIQGEYDSVSSSLKAQMDAVMKDFRLTWDEYTKITGILNGPLLGGARQAQSSGDDVRAAVAAEMIAAIDEANALLRAVYMEGDSVTAEEVAQMETLLAQIIDYRAQLAGVHSEVQDASTSISREIDAAMEDRQLELDEYERIKQRIDEEARPDAVAAMEDAATTSIGAELDATLTEFEALLDAINDRGGTMTEDEIARIGQYLTEIEALNARIDELQGMNKAVNAALAEHPAYQLTLSGYGTDETMVEALGATESLRRWQHDELGKRRVEIHERYVQEANQAGTDAEKAALRADYEAKIASLEAEAAAADANAQKNLNALFEGWLKSNEAYQADASEIDAIGKLIEIYSDAAAADSAVDAFKLFYDAGILNWKSSPRGATWAKLYGLAGEDGMALPYEDIVNNPNMKDGMKRSASKLINLLPELISQAASKYDGEDSPLIAMYQSMLDAGIPLDSLDVTQASGTLADILRLYLLREQGIEALGSEAMESIGSGIVESTPEAVEDAEDAAVQIGDAATTLIDGAIAGRTLVMSLAAGIASGTPVAVAAAQGLASQVSAALSGVYTHAPEAVLPAVAANASTANYDFSTNVHFGTGIFTSMNSVNAMAEKFNMVRQMKLAGVGQVSRP